MKTPAFLKPCAFTLIETMVAAAVVAVFMAGIFAVNTHCLRLLHDTDSSVSADLCVRDRLDKMRNAAWNCMVDPVYIRDTVLSATGNTFPNLDQMTVGIDVTAYNGTTGATPISVLRNASGTVAITATGDGKMINEKTIMVTTTVTWPVAGKTRTHQAYLLATNGGISGRNK